MNHLRSLFHLESTTSPALDGGRAPERWQQLMQRDGARLKAMRRASGWGETLFAINLKLLDRCIWGGSLSQVVSQQFAQSNEPAASQQSRSTHGHMGRTSSVASTRRSPDGTALTPRPPRRNRTPSELSSDSSPQSLAEPLRHQGAARRQWPNFILNDDSSASARATPPSNLFLQGSDDSPRQPLNVSEMPYRADHELLVRFHQPREQSQTATPANPRSPVSNGERLRNKLWSIKSNSATPLNQAAGNTSAKAYADAQATAPSNFHPATSNRRRHQSNYESSPGLELLSHDVATDNFHHTLQGEMAIRVSRLMNGISLDGIAPVAPLLLALREQMATTLDGETAPLDLLLTHTSQAIGHDEMSRKNSSRRTQTRAPQKANSESEGRTVTGHNGEFVPADAQRAVNARSVVTQSGGPKREAFQPPAHRSQSSADAFGSDIIRQDRMLHESFARNTHGPASVETVARTEGQAGMSRDTDLASGDVALAIRESGATSGPTFFEPYAATFAAPVLPPLVTPQSNETSELPVAVAVARAGERVESLPDGEDLDALAEKIKLILDEQARRHGIDV
ncbi:MAG TPA: hypothetical protein VGN95_20635 [Pyrinomonadaceae bacterium]|nr:hypothetical protein [Pyrinomonadaceae bacterium]